MIYFMDRFNSKKPTKIFVKVAANEWSCFAFNPKYKKYTWYKIYTNSQMYKKVNETTHIVKLFARITDQYRRVYIAN